MRHLLAATALLAGCATPPTAPQSLTPLRDMYNDRLAAYRLATADLGGWPSVVDCDALLWAGLARAAGAVVDLAAAESAPGQMHRRPVSSGECWPDESASTISNDMLWGYVHGADDAAVVRLADYGEAHGWVMGQPWPAMASRVLARPNLITVIGQRTGRWYGKAPCVLVPGVIDDYERHLHSLAALACGDYPTMVDPTDAVSLVAAGDHAAATALLLGDYRYPTYVRGADLYRDVHWLFAASRILR